MDYDKLQELDEVLADLTIAKKPPSKPPIEEGQLTVDVFRSGNEIVVQATVGGANNDDLDISIAKDTVTIKGHRQRIEKVKQSDYFHQELYWGFFSRSIILPEDIDVDKAKAFIKNGLLTLRLPALNKKSEK